MSEADELKKELFKMQDERKKIEDELILQRTVLESNKIGMKEKLVDEENFPRNDVDVYAVRMARNKIITLENDAKDLMNRMQSKLEQLHALTKPENES